MLAVATPSSAITTSLRAKFFRGLADPSRIAILEALREGSRTVGEIVAATGLGQPNASNHLACLFECGLVQRERRGRFMVYGLADPRIASLLALADVVVNEVAAAVEQCPRYELGEA